MRTRTNNALEKLIAGNKAFLDGVIHTRGRDLATLQKISVQKPYAAILSCSDSRISPELIFNAGFGDIFVIRVAGNTIETKGLESLEYAVSHLNVGVVMVLGHEDCGVVKAAFDSYPNTNLNSFRNLIESVYPVLKDSDVCMDQVTKKHTKLIANSILENSQVINDAQKAGNVEVVAGHFSLKSGEIEIL